MTKWEEFRFEERIQEALKSVTYVEEGHHLGRPFLTAYQLAIELARRHPEVPEEMGLEIGGKGIGVRTSLSQYIAGELSKRIDSGQIDNIEGAFISNKHLAEISFKHAGRRIVSSLTDSQFDLSMFRLRNM